MDFLFVNPITFDSSPSPQIGQLILHNIVSKKYESKWINFDLLHAEGSFPYTPNMDDNIERMAKYIADFNAQIIGIYTICNSFDLAAELALRIKQFYKEKPPIIVLGGPHASVLAVEILECFSFVDVICIGESENTILPLTDALISKDPQMRLQEVPGIAFRNESGIVCKNPTPPLISADKLGEYTVFEYGNHYKIGTEQAIDIEGGRGCPFRCTFCSTSKFWGAKHRVKPVDTLIKEMDTYHSLYGTHMFSIVHDHFTANRRYINDFCDKVKLRQYTWACSSRTDILDDELIANLISAGGDKIYLGIETGSQRMQKLLNKNLNISDVRQVLVKLKSAGMHVTVSFIYCFPEETIQDFLQTVKLIEFCLSVGIDIIQLHKFCLYAGSDETNKVPLDCLYFDDSELRMTKSEKNAFTTRGLEMVKSFPELFLHHYTFHTEVMDRYKYFDSFVMLFTLLNKKYRRTIEYLIGKKSMIELYESSAFILKQWNEADLMENDRRNLEMFEEVERKKHLRKATQHTFRLICAQDELAAILCDYETICANFLSDCDDDCAVAEFDYDINLALKQREIIRVKTYLKMNKENENLVVARLTEGKYKILQQLGYRKISLQSQ